MRTDLLLALLVLACNEGRGKVDAEGAGEDSGGLEDSGDGDDGEDTGDSGELPFEPDLGFDINGAWEGSTLTLHPIEISSLGSESPEFGDVLLSAPVEESPLELAAGRPPEDHLVELDPEEAPGLMAAFYVPALHNDTDGDGLPSEDEPYIGVGLTWPVWLEGPIPTELADLGLQAGWNALLAEGESGLPVDPMSIPVETGLLPEMEITIGGSYSGSESRDVRLVLLPAVVFEGEDVDEILFDEPLDDRWTASVPGEPPSDHMAPLGDGGIDGAMEIPLAYEDDNENGSFDRWDSPLYPACSGSSAVALVWFPPPTDLGVAMQLALSGASSGWTALLLDEGGGFLDEDERLDLDIGEGCSLE